MVRFPGMPPATTAEVRVYRAAPDFVEKGNARVNQKMVPIFVLLIAGSVLPIFLRPENRDDLNVMFFTLTFFALAMAFAVFLSLRRARACVRKFADTFELRVSETQLTRIAADTPDMTLSFADVTEAIQYPKRGMLLKTTGALQTLEFPEAMENYPEIVDFVRQRILVPLTVRDEKPWNSPVFAMVVGLALWVAFLNLNARIPVLLLGTALLGLAVWGIWALTKSPNVSKASKRSRLVYVFLIVITIARMLSVSGILR